MIEKERERERGTIRRLLLSLDELWCLIKLPLLEREREKEKESETKNE